MTGVRTGAPRRHAATARAAQSHTVAQWAACSLACAIGAWLLLSAGTLLPAAHAAGPAAVVTHGPTDRPQIALTFDDNFLAERSLPVLRALQADNCKATVFVTGIYVNGSPDINQEIVNGVNAGLFEVGDHSLTHPFLTALSWQQLMTEVGGGTDAFTALTGIRTAPLLRPPYGHSDATVAEAAGAKGFRYVVLWDVGSEDWTNISADKIRNDIVSNAHKGAIVLLHMSATHTFEAVPGIIHDLRARGYELVTVSELLKDGHRFLDVHESTPGASSIGRMVDGGFMSGYDENYFGPANQVTRAQFAKVAVLVAGLHTAEVETADGPTFSDVPLLLDSNGNPLTYPFDYVEEATAAGLVSGRPTGDGFTFGPRKPIARVQLAQILARMARTMKGYPQSWADGTDPVPNDVPDYAADDVHLVRQLGLMTGYTNGNFGAWDPSLRAHVAQVMTRFIDLAPYHPPTPTTTTTTTAAPPPQTTSTTAPPTTTTTSGPPTTSTTTSTTTTIPEFG